MAVGEKSSRGSDALERRTALVMLCLCASDWRDSVFTVGRWVHQLAAELMGEEGRSLRLALGPRGRLRRKGGVLDRRVCASVWWVYSENWGAASSQSDSTGGAARVRTPIYSASTNDALNT